ncbi:hypothetical protein CDA63_01225 [Hymenobacter amundsenii]|uniref:Uncharacterized protein n=1 Tax=Hymenobacter amundsenii TaxID=2006685 RepID=A0A246FQJ9_9BACT|nr:hypothetical protein [Hymenobacter amundsenii]OWP65008.1 hypothetical protein CDA63_01225 [Hymenobacter amundsenii]
MVDKQPAPGGDEWDDIVQQLRQMSEHVRQDGPLPEQERAAVESAFRQGLAHLENEVQGLRGGLKGSSGSF